MRLILATCDFRVLAVEAVVSLLAKKAKGLASKRDAAALDRISAAAERDAAGE